MYSPIRGELALIPGVTDYTGSGHPGSTAIKYVDILKTAIGYERVLVFFDHAALPTPLAPSANVIAATSFNGNAFYDTVDLTYSWVGMGGESAMSPATVLACGSSGAGIGSFIELTVPTFPTGIVSMNVFANGALCAVISKRNGVTTPTLVTLEAAPSITTLSNVREFRMTCDQFTVDFTTGGSLEAGKTYFFGFAPNYGNSNANKANAFDSPVTTNAGQPTAPIGVTFPTGRIFSFTVPEGYSKAILYIRPVAFRSLVESRANTAPFEWTENTGDALIGISYWSFLGTSPNDLMLCGPGLDGVAVPKRASFGAINDVQFSEVPYNSNITTFKQQSNSPISTDFSDAYNFIQLKAGLYQNYATYENTATVPGFTPSPNPNTPARSGIGIYAQTTLNYDATNAYQIMPARGCAFYSKNSQNFQSSTSFSAVFVPYSAGQFVVQDGEFQSTPNLNRNYFVNGNQSPFYTNGYVLSNSPRKVNTPYPPICSLIKLFGSRLVTGGGLNSLFNTQNVVYHTISGDPESWTETPSATAALAFVSALDADSDSIVGLGVYSESLNNSGNSAFLVIGKQRSCYTWNGSPASGAQQVAERTGFASKDSFSLTNYGCVFVGRENVYRMLSSGQAQKIGNDVQPILKALTDAQIQTVTVEYNDEHLKIGYQSLVDTAPRNIDTELWLNMRQDGGEILPVFSGPHLMKSYTGHVASNSFGTTREPRLSYLGTKIYLRDHKDNYLNDGASIAVFIESNDVGFGADEFAKIITQMFLRAKIKKSETITLGITVYDSSSQGKGLDYTTDNAQQTYSPTMILPYGGSGTIYRNFPKQFADRYRGDMLKYSLALSTNVDFRIQSMNWLFNIDRRRLL